MKTFSEHRQWPAVTHVAELLHRAGHKAFLAGGCVRDGLLGLSPKDFDLATSATPDEVVRLFPQALLIGKQFGVVIIPFADFQVEVATFRRDLSYNDGRRPEQIEFSNEQEDARRRDFTINALFYDLQKKQVLDFVDGLLDLKNQQIRAVGDPRLRFQEDKLRLLRAVRFHAQLGFALEPMTLRAVTEAADQIRLVSAERIREEMTKLLASEHAAEGLDLLEKTRLCKHLFAVLSEAWPEIPLPPAIAQSSFVQAKVSPWAATLESFRRRQSSPRLTANQSFLFNWSLFFLSFAKGVWLKEFSAQHEPQKHDWTSPAFRHSLKSELIWLKFSSLQLDEILSVLESYPRLFLQRQWSVSEFKKFFAQRWLPTALLLIEADAANHGWAAQFTQWYREACIRHLGDPPRLPQAFLSGADLAAAGLKPGPQFGRILRQAYDLQLEGLLKSRKQSLAWLANSLDQ